MKPTIKQLMEYNPCDEGRKYLKSKHSAQAAWRACDNPDWMIWALTTFNLWDERLARTFAIKCAEHTLHFFEEKHPEDKRPRLALQAAQDYQDEKITEEQRIAAESAARSAAWSAGEQESKWQADTLRSLINPFKSTKE